VPFVSGTDIGYVGRKKPLSVPDIFSIPLLLGEFTPREETIRHGTNLEFCYFGQMKASLDEEKTVQKNVSEGEM